MGINIVDKKTSVNQCLEILSFKSLRTLIASSGVGGSGKEDAFKSKSDTNIANLILLNKD